MTDKQIIKKRILPNGENFPVTVNADKKGFTQYGTRYYFTCQNCKNASWYDEHYCNNSYFYEVSKMGVKTLPKAYCKNYEVNNG